MAQILPPRKRRRADDTEHLKSKPVRGRRGHLQALTDIPLDVLFEVSGTECTRFRRVYETEFARFLLDIWPFAPIRLAQVVEIDKGIEEHSHEPLRPFDLERRVFDLWAS